MVVQQAGAQVPVAAVSETEVRSVMKVLTNDSLKGRGNGRPELLMAAHYIGNGYQRLGLQSFTTAPGYYLPFRPFGGSFKIETDKLQWNGEALQPYQFIQINTSPGAYPKKTLDSFRIIKLDTCFDESTLLQVSKETGDLLVWTDKMRPDGLYFPARFTLPATTLQRQVLLAVADKAPDSLLLEANSKYYNTVAYNVVGVLPGKSKPDELVVFSAHYDHEGIVSNRRDSIMNGANDNASGTTAVITLANYFARRNDNERTLVFCTFAGEELGLLGSKDFMRFTGGNNIIADINIEMIGIPQYGKRTVFITGADSSALGYFLETKLKKAGIRVIADKDPERLLYQRSDNYSFVQKGIKAHTIMSSDDTDKCYHQPCDELKRIDIPHLTAVINAIAAATEALINGDGLKKK